jgi:hypothetical protein
MRGYGDDSNILLGQRVHSSELKPCSVGSYGNIYATILFSFINNHHQFYNSSIILL